jgi:hypothetical protein
MPYMTPTPYLNPPNRYEESHVFKTDTEIAKFLQDRYLHYAMWQLYKIVGSLELVGNPIGMIVFYYI